MFLFDRREVFSPQNGVEGIQIKTVFTYIIFKSIAPQVWHLKVNF